MQPFVKAGPTVPEPQRDLRWQDVLSRPAPAGPQFTAMGELDFYFMQAVFFGSPNIIDTELQQFAADNNVNAASLGRQKDWDMWIVILRRAVAQKKRFEQQQAAQVTATAGTAAGRATSSTGRGQTNASC